MMTDYSNMPDNTPIIIGAGQHVEHITPGTAPPFSSPAKLAAAASMAAVQSTGLESLTEHIDTIAFVRLFSDSAPMWKSALGGSNNLPESLARLIGATPRDRIYSNVSGTEPVQLLIELAQAIAAGEKSLALLTGAEAIAYQKHARRNELEDNWEENCEAPLDSREYVQRIICAEELRSGMRSTPHYYALIENAQAHKLGHDVNQHRTAMAELFSPFSKVAAANPYAQYPMAYSVEELAEHSDGNYPLCIPYSKNFVAQDAVNQSATILISSVGKARALGIDPDSWIFLHGFAHGADNYVMQRPDPGHSQAIAKVMDATLEMAGARMDDVDLVDIYSCFPCAVTAVSDELGITASEDRPLTVTGGLPYFGGPGNNYSMHALAEMTLQLRASNKIGLVTANGGHLSKHAAVVLSNQYSSPNGKQLDWPVKKYLVVEPEDLELHPICSNPTMGTVVTYTVTYTRGRKNVGIVLAQTDNGERFLASTIDPEAVTSMEDATPIGRKVLVSTEDERHSFTFAQA